MKKNMKLMILLGMVLFFIIFQFGNTWYTLKYSGYGTYEGILTMSLTFLALFAGIKMIAYYIFNKAFKLNYDIISVFIINMIAFYIFIYSKGLINFFALLLLDPILIILLHYKRSDNRVNLYIKTVIIQVIIDIIYGLMNLVLLYQISTSPF